MLPTPRSPPGIELRDARAMLEPVFRDHPTHNFAVRLWNGQEVSWSGRRDFTLAFTDPETFRGCFGSKDPAQFAEAYVDGRLNIEGDLWEAAGLATYLRDSDSDAHGERLAPKLVEVPSQHPVARDWENVQAHYDLPQELFRAFLDDKRVYSCAYLSHAEQSLEQAQERKLDLICKKLALRPGERLLDVGCGWGALLIWAAQRHGVRAHGITLSANQADEVRSRVTAADLGERVTVERCHYADLPRARYDKISSIEMYEHVGLAQLPAYLGAIHGALRAGGLFLSQGTSRRPGIERNAGGAFIFRHVFPGGELVSAARLQSEMEDAGFEILDVQALGQHYALTLREWFERFRKRRGNAANFVSERLLRIWEVYLAGCARAFNDGVINVHQVLAEKPDARGRLRPNFARQRGTGTDEHDLKRRTSGTFRAP
ncbi:MAG: class I SAM-dependent methyltransferase [Myxococcales bacterium]|nr:class I SAM-dependent methyltransferase [Myxococcales bacterium]